MNVRLAALVIMSAAAVFGQKRFSWQDYCFKNPASPACKGNDYAVKPPPPAKNTTPAAVTNPFPSTSRATKTSSSAAPPIMAVASIDWRFADPFADALVGFNVSGISASPLAHSILRALAKKQGLSEPDLQKIFDGLSDVDQVALSVRNVSETSRVVAMITGHVADAALPAPEAGMKAVPVSAGVMLIGHADAVDQAMQRIAGKTPLSELARSAEQRQASSEFWIVGSAGLLGPQAAGAGLKRFALSVWIRANLTSDITFELNGVPNAKTLAMWKNALGSSAAVEGNVLHVRASVEAAEIQQKLEEAAAGPLSQGVSALFQAARYLPARDNAAPKQTKPVIYGLDPVP